MTAVAAHTEAFDLSAWTRTRLHAVESALDTWVSSGPACGDHAAPQALVDAMRYAVLDGGKRLRPLLVLAAYEAVGGHGGGEVDASSAGSVAPSALRAACAVELIHAYSLVHDDMPCMDNDVLRRGKPTVHVQYGQAQALLAGDALQALAFELLTPEDASVPLPLQALLCRMLSRAAGSAGMAGGQAIDLASVGMRLDETQLRAMHQRKTGALLQASVLMGAQCASVPLSALESLAAYGDAIGLAFQVVDDILDVSTDSATLGKTAGKDAQQDKPTFVSLLGLQGSQGYADRLLAQAHHALAQSGLPHTGALAALADKVVHRNR